MEQWNMGSLYVAGVIIQFKAAARVCMGGRELEDIVVQRRGLKFMRDIAAQLDSFTPMGRNILIPLLDDPDVDVRVYAAAYLVKVIPERALAVLKEIDETCVTRASMTAFRILGMHQRGEPPL